MKYLFKLKDCDLYYVHHWSYGKLTANPSKAYALSTKSGAERSLRTTRNDQVELRLRYVDMLSPKFKKAKRLGTTEYQYIKVFSDEYEIVEYSEVNFTASSELFVARERDGGCLCLFQKEPIKNDADGTFLVAKGEMIPGNMIILPDECFPEVTYENSPMRVDLILPKK